MIYFFSPFHRTGGPENTHFTCSIINQMVGQVVAKIIYITPSPGNASLYPEIPYLEFGTLGDVVDLPTNFIILPEIYHVEKTRRDTGLVNCIYVVWWQSFINACTNFVLSNYHIPGIMHAFHSYYEYAMVRPQLNQGQKYFLLTDFIADDYTCLDTQSFVPEKEPLVCFNGHKDSMSAKLCQEANIPFVEIRDMSREQVNRVLKRCMVYVDMGSHPGKDHMPREAAMYGCVVVTNKCGSAAYMEDVPIQEKVAFESDLVPLVEKILNNYLAFYDGQKTYRQTIKQEKAIAKSNIANFLQIHNQTVSVYEGILFVPSDKYGQVISQHNHILQKLEDICIEAMGSDMVEGNCFCENKNTRNRPADLIPKQMNLFSLGMSAQKVLEIGFNTGHSALLFLLANPSSKLLCFDIVEHPYTMKCFEYLQSIFGDRLEMIVGDSTVTIPKYCQEHPGEMFDVFHLDGSHDVTIARLDFQNTWPLVRDVIIFDDTQDEILSNLLNEYIDEGIVHEIKMRKTKMYEHRVVRKTTKPRTLTV